MFYKICSVICRGIKFIRPDHLKELKRRGLVVGKCFSMMGEVIVDPSHCELIAIGDNVTLAPRVHILAHDASTNIFLGYSRTGHVRIGSRVFVGAGAIILPNVIIGDDVIIGAGSVVTKDLKGGYVYAGNPATRIKTISQFKTENETKRRNRLPD